MKESPIAVLSDVSGNTVTTAQDGASVRRLHVDVRGSAVPGSNVINRYLLNGTNSSMIVNGSGTPVAFSYAPASNQTAVIQSIDFLITAGSITFNGSRFLAANAMTNGLAYYATTNGVQNIFSVFKINEDFPSLNTSCSYWAAVGGGLLGGGTNAVMNCSMKTSISLNGANGDSLGILVRDALTSTGGNLIFCASTIQGYIAS